MFRKRLKASSAGVHRGGELTALPLTLEFDLWGAALPQRKTEKGQIGEERIIPLYYLFPDPPLASVRST